MRTRCVILLTVLIVLIFYTQPAIADDLAELKAAHEMILKAWHTKDVEVIFDSWLEDGGVWLSQTRGFPIPVKKSPAAVQRWTKWFENHIVRLSWYNPQYRVIGNTGLVWGLLSELMMNTESGIAKESYTKVSVTYVKSGGKWKVFIWHSSPIPSQREIF